MFRRRRTRRGAGGGQPRVALACSAHAVDLDALRHYVEDGRPDLGRRAPALIVAGECPACRPRYAVEGAIDPATTSADERVSCPCCGSRWLREGLGWAAVVGQGLEPFDGEVRVPEGVTIDSSSFFLEAFDPDRVTREAVRGALFALPAVATSSDAEVDDALDELLEGIDAALAGRADPEAEVWRATHEHELDPRTARAIEERAIEVLDEVDRLLRGGSARDDDATEYLPGEGRAGFAVSTERFEGFVREAINSLPSGFQAALDDVAIVVRDRSTERALYGLYEGVPLTKRWGGAHPDRITIFKDEICEDCSSEEEVRAQVRKTVLHEIGHYFGLGERRLRELGWG